VDRNAFGRQIDSFVDAGTFRLPGVPRTRSEMVFIRAPRIRSVGPGVEILATWREEPVLVRQGRVLGATFHPEMSPLSPFPEWFLREVAETRTRLHS
jgi:5'-phosphate synthase pdxT subunit